MWGNPPEPTRRGHASDHRFPGHPDSDTAAVGVNGSPSLLLAPCHGRSGTIRSWVSS